MTMTDIEDLRRQWTKLCAQTLPQMAKSRDPSQGKWPVTLDHCFARIILDNAVGEGQRQWDVVIKKPAIKNMSEEQLRRAISLGEKVKSGEADLCHLDQMSLQCRGKNSAKYTIRISDSFNTKLGGDNLVKHLNKRSMAEMDNSEGQEPPKKIRTTGEKWQSTLNFGAKPDRRQPGLRSEIAIGTNEKSDARSQEDIESLKKTLSRIQTHPTLSAYRKRLYTTLLSVPRGRYTTYAAMSDYLHSSARAVGNGMRNNPFAPEVPCHRVLAANGSIGGFNGEWGKDGKYANKKIELLRDEGVRFHVNGKVIGEPFRNLHTFKDIDH
jgi:O-6-methylguanine DNA methyltransferase